MRYLGGLFKIVRKRTLLRAVCPTDVGVRVPLWAHLIFNKKPDFDLYD